jgi:hypothetical protein
MPDDDLSAEEQEALESASDELDAQGEVEETNAEAGNSPSPTLQSGGGGTEAAEAEAGWQSTLQEAGFQTFDNVDNAVNALVESNRQRDSQIQQYADQLRFYQDQLNSRQQTTQQEQYSPEPQKPSDPLSEIVDGWEDPSFANQWIETDHEGNRFISEEADDETREKILGIDRNLKKWQQVLQDPRAFAKAIDQRVDAMIADRFESNYQQKQSQAQEDQAVDSFVSSNANWLYVKDPATGEFVTDPRTGEFVYSDHGSQFLGHMNSVAKDGVSSVSSQIRYASMAMGLGSGSQSGQAASSGAPESSASMAQNQRAAMRGRSNTARGRQSSFNGVSTEPASGNAGRNEMSFGEETLAAMKAGE